ncbi:MAG TPA: LamG domain-containing protein, partial [Solirubrobacterales bacterium]|nr:LamG domain-containing protein [Solirubrobacterales bacterium]
MAAAALRPDATAATQITSNTPIAAYSFDAGEGEVAEDLAGENDGVVEGAEWFEKGKYGKALLFDGPETCVTVPHHDDLQLSEEMTVEAWVKPSSLSDQPILYKSAWGNLGYALGISFFNYAKPEGLIGEGVGKYEDVVSPNPVEKNVWRHLAFSYDGATMRLYVNGQLVASQAQSTPPPTGEGPLAIGCNPLYPEDFDGLIDEVRIYNRALSIGEVNADAAKELQTPPRPPVASYSFDEGEGSVLEDSAGNNDGAIEGAEWFDKGKFGSALHFDGVEGEQVTVPDSNDLDLTDELTLEAWVRPTEAIEWSSIVTKKRGSGISYQLVAHGDHNAPVGYLANAEKEWGVDGGTTPLPAKTWSHIAFTSDGGRLRFYVNGKLKGSDSMLVAAAASTGPLVIGGETFKGRIDEVRIYDRALGEGEIAADKGAPIETPSRGPVAAYSFDAGAGNVAEDLAGEFDGAIEGAGWFGRGRYGSALSFDGENDCVTIADANDLELSEELTVEAWVKPRTDSDLPIIYKDSWGNAAYALGIGLYGTGNPEGLIGEGVEEVETVVGPEDVEENVWTHLAFTYDGAQMRIYVNGALAETDPQPTGPPTGEGALSIGCNHLYPEDFEGLIDEVRVYDRALSDEEVVADKGAPIQTSSPGAVAAYSFDAGEGEIAEDLVGEHDGTLNSVDWVRGKYGQALYFDGVGDYVEIPDSPELQLGEEFTLQAWVRPDAVE